MPPKEVAHVAVRLLPSSLLSANVAGAPVGMAGTDPTVIIPILSITQADGAAFKAAGTEVEGKTMSWRRADVIVVPSWREHVHRSDDGAVLFQATDEPVMKKLGFLREGNGARPQ